MKTLIRSINRSPLRGGFFTLAIALCWFALSPPLKAVDCPSTCFQGGNVGVGPNALDSVNPAVGINNTAVGTGALTADTTGAYNVAIGNAALQNNTTGQFNMAIGAEALSQNNANFNLAIGFRVLFMNTTGNHLTGIGAAALRNNTTAGFNTAIGADAMRENTGSDSEFNVAVGDSALQSFNGTATTDGANTALGSIALVSETSGEENVAVGRRALESLVSGSNNVAVGWRSGDIATTSDDNVFLGSQAGNGITTVNNNIVIGHLSGNHSVFGQISDRCFIDNIFGNPVSAGTFAFVLIDSDGRLGTFTVADGIDTGGVSTPGVHQPAKPEAMLNLKVGKLQATVAQQQKQIETLMAQLKEQAAQIQKVSAQVEMGKPTAKVVNNNH